MKYNIANLWKLVAIERLFAIVGILLCMGCSGIREKPLAEIMASVKRPTTPEEILKNIKIAIDNDLMTRSEFYTEENVQHFFGGKKIKISRENVLDLAADSYEYDYLGAADGNGSYLSPLEISLNSWQKDKKNYERLDLISLKRGLFPDLPRCVEIFGPGSEHFDVLQPHENADPQTSRFGNESIRYLRYGAAHGQLLLRFFGDGSLYQMSFRENAND